MSKNILPVLKIGNLEVKLPIIQGGMGVRVSGAKLAGAAANAGCIGVIATAGVGQFESYNVGSHNDQNEQNRQALREEIRKARKISPNGVIGVNILAALEDYDNIVTVCVEEDVDVIISGAGLPLSLPESCQGKDIKLLPIASSVRTLEMICKRWIKRYNRLPDAIVVEGTMAGGHLGFSQEDAEEDAAGGLEKTISEVLEYIKTLDGNIPVIAAGGVFDGADIKRMLDIGASGVQMATRFVCTDECDVHENFKKAFINAKKEDITIIKSPVGLPGRVINSDFVEKIKNGKTIPFKCKYRCLRGCKPNEAPYCIAEVLANAANGKMEEAFAFAGSNAYKCTEIIPVQELVNKLQAEYDEAFA